MIFKIWSLYKGVARKLSLDNFRAITLQSTRHRIIMPVSGMQQDTLAALHYARRLSDDVTAVHVSIEPAESERRLNNCPPKLHDVR